MRTIVIENIAINRRIDLTLTGSNIISFTAASVFLPYILSAFVLAFLSIYIIANQHTRQLIFLHKGSRALKAFFIYMLVLPLLFHNWKGFAVGIGVLLMLILGLYLRSVMTRDIFENVLTMICTLSLTSAGYAFLESFVNYLDVGRNTHRISAVFSHPNYFGTVVATVIIICAYKVLTSNENKLLFCTIAGFNVFSLYLCKSLFAFIEVFIGISVLLIILKSYRLLILWLSAAVVGAILIFLLDVNIVPRLYDVSVTIKIRLKIWSLAWEQIKNNPFFGHGFMSFGYLFDATYKSRQIPHSHSIYLDMILNFGIVGSVLFLWYFVRYYRNVCKTWLKRRNNQVASIILAVSAAAFVHGATDLTILWIQTLPLLLFLLAGQGAEERAEQLTVILNYSNEEKS